MKEYKECEAYSNHVLNVTSSDVTWSCVNVLMHRKTGGGVSPFPLVLPFLIKQNERDKKKLCSILLLDLLILAFPGKGTYRWE